VDILGYGFLQLQRNTLANLSGVYGPFFFRRASRHPKTDDSAGLHGHEKAR